ncbi:MAG: hypothetical protein K8E24_006475 [Methanobacterium paludis]|nr:hypothetical protein [Methanobacterium paludis]
MIVSENIEKKQMNHDLDLIEDYLNKRFELKRNELVFNLEAFESRYKFNYSKGIDALKEFMDFYKRIFSKLNLVSIKSFMNNHNAVWVEIGYKSEVLNQMEKLEL